MHMCVIGYYKNLDFLTSLAGAQLLKRLTFHRTCVIVNLNSLCVKSPWEVT